MTSRPRAAAPDEASPQAFGLDWPYSLFPYQIEGIERLLSGDPLLLADEMGLGKTIQAIAALRILVARRKIRRALIVCPVGLIAQWRRQVRIWAPDMVVSTAVGPSDQRRAAWRAEATLYLSSFESIRADFASTSARADRPWDVVVVDEAQRIKNARSGVAEAVKSLERRLSWALTGTPLENRLDDLLSVLDFVAPGAFDAKAMGVGLRSLMSQLQLRRRRAEVLDDLPPKFASVVGLDLHRVATGRLPQRRTGRDHLAALAGAAFAHCACARAHPPPQADLQFLSRDRRIGQAGSTYADASISFAPAGEKALIFSQFVKEPFGVLQLARELRAFGPIVLTGDMDPSQRSAALDTFTRDGARGVMILSLRAGGTGLNLTSASRVIHFDRWWNPAVETQAEDRVHRIGQTRPVEVFAYLSADTVEERIAEILDEKRALFADWVDGVPASALGRLDLDSLIRAAAPAF